MLYRVLSLALLCSAPAAAAVATMPPVPVTSVPASEASPLAVRLYGFRATGEPAAHPMSAANGNWRWDALGGGCVDAGHWTDAFPAGKGDLRAEAFCVPQPCVQAMTPQEFSREVLGREVEPEEYRTYLHRLEEACGPIPASPLDAGNGLEDLLELASLDWVMSSRGELEFVPEEFLPVAWEEAPGAGVEWVYPPSRRASYASIVPMRPSSGGSGARGSGGSRAGTDASGTGPGRDGPGAGQHADRPGRGNDKPGTGKPGPDRPDPDLPEPPTFPEVPGGGLDPNEPDQPETPDQPGAPTPAPSPSPVPVPGGLPLLLSGIAALGLGRRLAA